MHVVFGFPLLVPSGAQVIAMRGSTAVYALILVTLVAGLLISSPTLPASSCNFAVFFSPRSALLWRAVVLYNQ